MKVWFLTAGDGPDFGPFTEGEERELDDALAEILESRGVASLSNPSDGPDPSDDFDLQEVR